MKTSPLAVASIALAASAQAQTVQWGITKRHDMGIRRRAANAFDTTINNSRDHGGYFIDVEVGTPGQKLSLQLDTGSSDVWVPFSRASICTDVTDQNPGCTQGSYDPDKSSTFKDIGPGDFDISYVDQSGSKGDYVQDTLQIGGNTVSNLTMGLGLKTTIAFGLIGVGYASNEASIQSSRTIYPNLPVVLQQEGLIKTVAYSLWLNDLSANQGSLLFGGIDTEKYHGDLTKLNLVSPNGGKNFTEFAVHVYSVEASSPSGSDVLSTSEGNFVAVLDSGTTLTYLPQDMAQQAWDEVGAEYNVDAGLAVVPCDAAKSAGAFTFGFGNAKGPRINVTMDELVVGLTDGQAPTFDSGPNKGKTMCEFGIQNQTETPYLLGDTFLRSAYVVYDLVNNQVAIAATDFDSTKTNVIAFPSNGAAIPSATALSDSNDDATPPASHGGSLAASKGFQDENAAATRGVFSTPGMVIVGLSIGYSVLGGALFGIGWL